MVIIIAACHSVKFSPEAIGIRFEKQIIRNFNG